MPRIQNNKRRTETRGRYTLSPSGPGVQINLRLPPDLVATIDALAAAAGTSRSAIIKKNLSSLVS